MNPRLKAIMARVFCIPPDSLSPETSQADVPAWDSQGHLDLMMRIESEFCIELDLSEVVRMRTVDAIERVLAAHGAMTPV